MEKIKKWFKNRKVQYTFFTLVGLLLGWLFFSSPSTETDNGAVGEAVEEVTEWTCSMHPQIRMDNNDVLCPLCAMDLTPVRKSGGDNVDPDAIQLTDEAMALADVETSRVSKENPEKSVRLYGKITTDERNLQSQTAHIGGRIESLNVEFTGETVRAGQTLATLYSPELFTAQQELQEAIKIGQPALIEAAREKMKLWKVTPAQIKEIERSGKISPYVDIKANTSGIVISKRVSHGDYVAQGAVLFDIANLSKLWAMFDAYEVDLPFLSVGDKIEFTLQALPGNTFKGKISFIDPIINPVSRTARVRVEVANPNMDIKPEMYASAIVNATMKGHNDLIVVPKTAILWTGKRAVVYVKQPEHEAPTFMMREIVLGPSLGESYIVLEGLSEGEDIVTSGVFLVDASAQLEGKLSMMNNPDEQTNREDIYNKHLGVGGSCGMCKTTIENTSKEIDGVITATWVQDAQMLHLKFNNQQTSLDEIAKAIAKVGYDNDKYRAEDSVYDALPGCCQYRK